MKSPRTPEQSSAGAVGGAAAGSPHSPPGAPPQRLFGADALKAAAIVGVVFIHADGVFGMPSAFYDAVADMFRFGVPAFIALYVHFACKGMVRRADAGAYLRERFIRLFTQFMFWSAVYAALTADWGQLTPLKFLTRHWSGSGWAGQFYFILILQLTVLMPWLLSSGRWFGARRGWLLGGGVVVYALLADTRFVAGPLVGKLSDRPFVYWLPYAWLGVAWVGSDVVSRISGRGWRTVLAASVALIPIEHRLIQPPITIGSLYLMPSVFIATVALLALAASRPRDTGRTGRTGAAPNWLHHAVQLLSANTLGIFVLNPMVILLFHRLASPPAVHTGLWPTVGLPVTALALVLPATLGLTLAIKRSSVGRRLVT